uniref:Uncharacterized protein n=1 Tax=Oryza glaberrima TaxID=4538 RepID=I1R165_ORYGL
MVDVIAAAPRPSYLFGILVKTETRPVELKLPELGQERPHQAGALAVVLAGGGRPAWDNTTGHDPTFLWNMPKAGMDQVRTAELHKHGTEAAAVTVRLRGGHGRVRRRPPVHLLHHGGAVRGDRLCGACP